MGMDARTGTGRRGRGRRRRTRSAGFRTRAMIAAAIRAAAPLALAAALTTLTLHTASAQNAAPAAEPKPPAAHHKARPIAKPAAAQPAATQPAAAPNTPAPNTPAPDSHAAAGPEPDLAYGAYQRGFYLTAFAFATRRVEEKNDPKSMTLLGGLYAQGLGVAQDDKKAAEWYTLAAARGDREAMFALAMFGLQGRAGPRRS